MDNNKEYKGFVTNLGIRAQAAGLSAALSSPAWLTKAVRHVATRHNPAMVEGFIDKYGIDYSRATKCSTENTAKTCAQKYGTLDSFFTRQVRGISVDSGVVVSPADCKAVLFDDFPSSGVWVKGKKWTVERLLKTRAFEPIGPVGIFRLRPMDYHRFHSPVSGEVTNVRKIKGVYLSVDPTVVHSRNVFTENTRVVVTLATRFGTVYFVAVGAAGVGKVHIFPDVGDTVQAGDELGMFSFGGSTVVVLLPPGMAWDRPTSKEVYMQVGTALL